MRGQGGRDGRLGGLHVAPELRRQQRPLQRGGRATRQPADEERARAHKHPPSPSPQRAPHLRGAAHQVAHPGGHLAHALLTGRGRGERSPGERGLTQLMGSWILDGRSGDAGRPAPASDPSKPQPEALACAAVAAPSATPGATCLTTSAAAVAAVEAAAPGGVVQGGWVRVGHGGEGVQQGPGELGLRLPGTVAGHNREQCCRHGTHQRLARRRSLMDAPAAAVTSAAPSATFWAPPAAEGWSPSPAGGPPPSSGASGGVSPDTAPSRCAAASSACSCGRRREQGGWRGRDDEPSRADLWIHVHRSTEHVNSLRRRHP